MIYGYTTNVFNSIFTDCTCGYTADEIREKVMEYIDAMRASEAFKASLRREVSLILTKMKLIEDFLLPVCLLENDYLSVQAIVEEIEDRIYVIGYEIQDETNHTGETKNVFTKYWETPCLYFIFGILSGWKFRSSTVGGIAVTNGRFGGCFKRFHTDFLEYLEQNEMPMPRDYTRIF